MHSKEKSRSISPPYPKPIPQSKNLYKSGIWSQIKTLYYLGKSPIHAICTSNFTKDVTFKVAGITIKFVGQKERANDILSKNDNEMPKSVVVNGMLEPLLRKSIFNTNGELWKKYRTVLSKGLDNIHTKKSFPIMLSATKDYLSEMPVSIEAVSINIEEKMTNVTADVIFRTILSSRLTSAELKDFVKTFIRFQHNFIKRLKHEALGTKRYLKKLNSDGYRIRQIIESRIDKRYQSLNSSSKNNEEKDMLESFINASLDEETLKISKDEMVDQICMLFLAGHETSAAALSWSFYLLSIDLDTQNQVHNEITKHIGNRDIEFDDLKKLTKTSAVLFESMRLYPPVYILPREESWKCPHSGKVVRKEHNLINNWVLHRNEKYWQNPNEFCPARFEEKSHLEYTKEGSYLPFAKGHRACIGKAFAIQESIIILAETIKRYEILPSGRIPKPRGAVTLRTKGGIYINIRKRNKTQDSINQGEI